MTVIVPGKYIAVIQRAAKGTGLAYQICAAQAYVESGFRPDVVSSAGAEGFWQFLPGTFRSYGKGSPFNVDDATGAYINFMRYLLRYTHGNVRNALAAYNAGPGNIPAGIPYADEILRLAGSSQSVAVTPVTTTSVVVNSPIPAPTDDDPSWWINRSGQWLKDLAGTCNFYANAIGRL